MGKLRGFMEYDRIKEEAIDPKKRIENYKEFTLAPKSEKLQEQGGRCMDCGVPFCHSGCPLGNLIPDFNDAENMDSSYASARAEMKGPGDLRDILAGLKTKTININEGKKEGSTISLQELEEIQSTDLSSKNNKMVKSKRKKSNRNVVNLGI